MHHHHHHHGIQGGIAPGAICIGAAACQQQQPSAALPYTGANLGVLTAIGIALVMSGAVMRQLSRRGR